MGEMSETRKWLMKKPLLAKVRVVRDDGTTHMLEVQADKRGGFLEAEESMQQLMRGAEGRIEALTADGSILRAAPFHDPSDGDADEEGGSAKKEKPGVDITDRVIQRMGEAIEKAYKAGAEASAASQAKLVELVDKLTTHLSVAIQEHHKSAIEAATVAGADPQAMMAMQLMSANAGAGGTPQQQSPMPTPAQVASFVTGLSPQNRGLLQAALSQTANGKAPNGG